MLFSIDFQHFMTHMIDYFTADELLSFQYMIISAKLKNQRRLDNVIKPAELYPTPDMLDAYLEYKDPKILRKLYDEYFKPDKGDKSRWQDNMLYRYFISLVLNRQNVLMISDEIEYDYIKAISGYLKDNYHIETIDLNELFSKGRIGPIYIDRNDIRDRAVDIRRVAEKTIQKGKESTEDGRAELMNMMTKKEKIKKLKSIGINVDSNEDIKEIDSLLIDEWVKNKEE